MGEIIILTIAIYLISHIPAILLLISGFYYKKTKPDHAKILFILAGVYFIIGGGICGAMLKELSNNGFI